MKPITTYAFLIAAVALLATSACLADPASPGTKRIIETPISAAPSYAKYALVIGVTDYQAAAQLTVCGDDATRFAAMLKKRYGFPNVVLMTDNPGTPAILRPTQRNIEDALDALYGSIIPGKSEVVFFYSGHGTRAPDGSGADSDWLVPEDGRPNHVGITCINYDAIRRTIDTKSPKRALIITDACRDLLNGKGVGSSHFGGLGKVFGSQIAEMQSCQPTECSLEGDPHDFHESVFTHYLIRGMSGDPDAIDPDKGAVTFDSLKQYVQYSVRAYAAKLNTVQTPDGRASFGSMVIAKSDGQAPSPDSIDPDPMPIASPKVAENPQPVQVAAPAPPSDTTPWATLSSDDRAKAFSRLVKKLIQQKASKDDMSAAIKSAVAGGADIDCTDVAGYPGVVKAAFMGSDDMVQALVEQGANMDAPTVATPGVASAEKAEADDNAATTDATASFMKAGDNGIPTLDTNDVGGITSLFKHSKKKDVPAYGLTALMYAAKQGDDKLVSYLLNAKADPTVKDSKGSTAYDYARDAKQDACAKLLRS